jgi:hypothetical protein
MTLYKATFTNNLVPPTSKRRERHFYVVSENIYDAQDLIKEEKESEDLIFKLIQPVSNEGVNFFIDTSLRSDLKRK